MAAIFFGLFFALFFGGVNEAVVIQMTLSVQTSNCR